MKKLSEGLIKALTPGQTGEQQRIQRRQKNFPRDQIQEKTIRSLEEVSDRLHTALLDPIRIY